MQLVLTGPRGSFRCAVAAPWMRNFLPSWACLLGGWQHRNRLDLYQRFLARQAGNRNRRAGRPVLVGQIAVPHVTEDRQVFHIDEIIVELHDVLELPPDGGKRVLQVLEGLHRLLPEIAAELALLVDPELASYVDDAGRRRDLDHMRIAGRPSKRRGVDEPGLAHGICPLSMAGIRTLIEFEHQSRSHGRR